MLATGLAMSQVLLAVQYGRDHKEKSREGSNRILPKRLKSTSALNEGYRYTSGSSSSDCSYFEIDEFHRKRLELLLLRTPEAPAGAKEHAASYSNYDRNRFHRKHFLDSSILLPCSDPYYQLCFSSGKRESWPFWQSSSRLLSGNVAVFVFFVCS